MLIQRNLDFFPKQPLFLVVKKKILMRTLFTFCICVLSFSLANAQFMPTANLTIFSEDGNKFFLILNGERQNDVAQTNIRLEELPQPYYNCKIVFEDPSLKEISKNMLMLSDANGVMQDVTYKIKKDKNGKATLRFFSFVPAQQNMIRPSNCAVYRYGNPGMIIAGPGFSANTGNGGVGMQMNGGGVNINVRVDDDRNTYRQNDYNDNYNNNNYNNNNYNNNYQNRNPTDRMRRQDVNNHYYAQNDQRAQGCFNAYPMDRMSFDDALKTLKNEGFDETRLDIAKQIASTNCLNTNQISSMCQAFGFEASKLEFAKYAYDHCTDPNSYFKIVNIFSFSSSKTELNNYIKGR